VTTVNRGKRIGIYAGTFDPITEGHLDVIKAGSKLMDSLIVAVGINKNKKSIFDIEARLNLIEATIKEAGLDNVSTTSFGGLIAEFAKEKGADFLVRGLRTETDYIYEMQMAMMNCHLDSSLQTIFVPTRQNHSHISSSLVKEVAKLGGDITNFVSKPVAKALNEVFSK
jgi:pantetheine-phosphate adenylyltransferase